MKVLYFSQDYTTHDWRFLDGLAKTSSLDVSFLRLEKRSPALENREVPAGIKVISWSGGKGPMAEPSRVSRLLPELKRVIDREKPDLIHAGPIPSCGLLAALSGFRPLVLMSWGSDITVPAAASVQVPAIKYALRRADIVIGDCRTVREGVLAYGSVPGERIITFPWGVDLDTFQPRASRAPSPLRHELGWDDKPVIISTRAWETSYAIETLLQAFAKLHKRLPETRLMLLGDGSLAAHLNSFIQDNGLAGSMHIAGQVRHSDLSGYFGSADVYVSSAPSDGTSVSLLEAMACGLPVVVVDNSSNREWITPGVNGYLCSPRDSGAMEQALRDLLTLPNEAVRMGRANVESAKARADWNANFKELLSAYRLAADNRNLGALKETQDVQV